MERLQEAIDKARAAASTNLPVTGRRAGQPVTLWRSGTDQWPQLRAFAPVPAHLERNRILSLKGGPQSAPFDLLRTKAIQTMRANGWRRLAITSATAGCGKSTVALNLGLSLSRQPTTRTILTELDLRAPSLAALLGADPTDDVSAVLDGSLPFADQALCLHGNLAMALCNGRSRPPADLLHRPAAAQHLAEIEARFRPDLMLFDMPPLLQSDDMLAFAGQVDCVLLVAAAEQTTAREIDHCERELARQTNVMGVVLNKCRWDA